jgi:hypothetical protein
MYSFLEDTRFPPRKKRGVAERMNVCRSAGRFVDYKAVSRWFPSPMLRSSRGAPRGIIIEATPLRIAALPSQLTEATSVWHAHVGWMFRMSEILYIFKAIIRRKRGLGEAIPVRGDCAYPMRLERGLEFIVGE